MSSFVYLILVLLLGTCEHCEEAEIEDSREFINLFNISDYKGQKLAEQIFQGIIIISAVVGFVYGLIIQQFGWTVYIVLTGFVVSCIMTLPPWPMYRRNPLPWQPVIPETSADASQKPQESQKKKKHK